MSLIYCFDLIDKNRRFTRSQNVPNFGLKCSISLWFLTADPARVDCKALPDPLVVRDFLPSAIAASRLRRLQFDPLTQLLDLNFPLQAPYSIPGSAPHMTFVELI